MPKYFTVGCMAIWHPAVLPPMAHQWWRKHFTYPFHKYIKYEFILGHYNACYTTYQNQWFLIPYLERGETNVAHTKRNYIHSTSFFSYSHPAASVKNFLHFIRCHPVVGVRHLFAGGYNNKCFVLYACHITGVAKAGNYLGVFRVLIKSASLSTNCWQRLLYSSEPSHQCFSVSCGIL